MQKFILKYQSRVLLLLIAFFFPAAGRINAQQPAVLEGRPLYDALKKFELQGKASVSGLELKRDRAEMVFTGDFYFAAPVNGRVTGAIFIGDGTFRAAPPTRAFEKESLQKFLKADVAESDFHTAVLRFSDDTFDVIGKQQDTSAAAPKEAQRLAAELEPRMLKETGANISARLLISMANNESPGIFLAQFDKGRRNRFTFLLDPQARIPSYVFNINGGEKVLLFRYSESSVSNDLWIATFSEEDYKKGQVKYSDSFDVVSPLNYDIKVDLREPRKMLRTSMRIDLESSTNNLRALPMTMNDDLSEYDNVRLKYAMRLKGATFAEKDLPFIQEDWEMGLTLLFPKALQQGEKFSVELWLEGDFIDRQTKIQDGFYPQSNSSWYPRHGYLKRATYDMTFRHRKHHQVVGVGKLIREGEWPDAKDDRLTEFRIDKPVSFVTFAAGSLERHAENRKLSFGEVPISFYSLPSSIASINESFILAELGNALDYFGMLFGPYPYGNFGGAFHPFNFGQGFPTMLMIPNTDQARRAVYAFIAHETAHQWWGNIVAWRSYRDQWLSEGFAEYSGILYTHLRDKQKDAEQELIKAARYTLTEPPVTGSGIGSGKVAEIGPLILGLRLQTRNSRNAYSDLIYKKGALVLRMLHFLFSDPTSGNGQPFFDMMADFVKRYENKAASTEDFADVASADFLKTPIAKHFGLKDLNWFFEQWVFGSNFPSYRMEYKLEPGEGGQCVVKGTVYQENAGPDWFMPLPVVFTFGENRQGRSLVYVKGPQTPFQMTLPMKPSSVELDPDHWILSDKTSTKRQ